MNEITEQPKDNKIRVFFHCNTCADDRPNGVSPREWVRIETGWTKKGFQVWCVRCEKNIVAFDFGGMKVKPDDLKWDDLDS